MRKILLALAALVATLAVAPNADASHVPGHAPALPWTGTIIISNTTVTWQNIPTGWSCSLTSISPYEVTCAASPAAPAAPSASCPLIVVTASTAPGAVRGEVACEGTAFTTRSLAGYDADVNRGGVEGSIRRVFCRAFGVYGNPNPLGTFSVSCGPDPGVPPL